MGNSGKECGSSALCVLGLQPVFVDKDEGNGFLTQ
jgi:hypothetical protein